MKTVCCWKIMNSTILCIGITDFYYSFKIKKEKGTNHNNLYIPLIVIFIHIFTIILASYSQLINDRNRSKLLYTNLTKIIYEAFKSCLPFPCTLTKLIKHIILIFSGLKTYIFRKKAKRFQKTIASFMLFAKCSTVHECVYVL